MDSLCLIYLAMAVLINRLLKKSTVRRRWLAKLLGSWMLVGLGVLLGLGMIGKMIGIVFARKAFKSFFAASCLR